MTLTVHMASESTVHLAAGSTGGEHLGSSDEIKIFKTEGEESEEIQSSEKSLTEGKFLFHSF